MADNPSHRDGPSALSACRAFADLAARAAEREAIDRALRQTLPATVRAQVRFADVRQHRLVFLAASPAWASRLRLLQGPLLATAQSLGMPATALVVKVTPWPRPLPPEPAAKPLPAAAALHLEQAALATEDQELRTLFRRLAARAQPPAD